MIFAPFFLVPMIVSPFYFLFVPPPAAVVGAVLISKAAADEAGDRIGEMVVADMISHEARSDDEKDDPDDAR